MIHSNIPGWCRHLSAFVLLTLILAGCGEQRFQAAKARDFTLPLLDDGGVVSLQDFQGQVVYLTFWASWCTPCRQEMPYLAQLWDRHQARGFQVVAINVDEQVEHARQFAANYSLPFPLVYDGAKEISGLYHVPGYPTHYIIDRSGHIRFSGLGFNLADVGAISQEVETLLAESVDAAD